MFLQIEAQLKILIRDIATLHTLREKPGTMLKDRVMMLGTQRIASDHSTLHHRLTFLRAVSIRLAKEEQKFLCYASEVIDIAGGRCQTQRYFLEDHRHVQKIEKLDNRWTDMLER